jgi:hypothetical protein
MASAQKALNLGHFLCKQNIHLLVLVNAFYFELTYYMPL